MAALASSCWFTMEPSAHLLHKKGLCQQKATEFKKHMLKSCKLYQVHPVLMVSGSHRNSHYMRTNIEMSTPDSKSLVYWGASDFGVKISGFCGDRPVAKGERAAKKIMLSPVRLRTVSVSYTAWKWALQFIAICLGTSRKHLKLFDFSKWHSNSK